MFEDLYLVATKYTPDIALQANGRLSFTGKSYPENTYEYYAPVIEWLNEYFRRDETSRVVVVDFEVSYFNSSSSKLFFDIFDIFNIHKESFQLKIRWNYDEENDNALEAGQDFIDDFPDLSILLVKTN